ncbi:MAG: sugar O-acetyltransferase [Oscillospiraceae bacterium]|nr:sugar O-acetyltransferase [Oscillospiraceae bacterium]
MTEREKMCSGQLYDPADPELAALRAKARQLAARYNRTREVKTRLRQKLLHSLLGSSGEYCEFTPPFRFDYGCNTYVGDRCFFNFNCTFLDCAEIHIGDDVFVGPNVSFLTPMHLLLAEQRNMRRFADGSWHDLEYALPITIGDGVWLAGGVTVNPGVTIGSGAVIGSGSVVTKSIPPQVLAAGAPCRVLRPLTQADRAVMPAGFEQAPLWGGHPKTSSQRPPHTEGGAG